MNLSSHPTKTQLRDLLSSADDEAGHHMIWVSDSGDVHADSLPEDEIPVTYVEQLPTLRFRLETLQCGTGYVGPEAAKDSEWVDRLFEALTTNWDAGTQDYVDHF